VAHAFEIRKIRRHAGADAGDDQGIGQAALKSIASGIFDRQIAQRNGVLHENVCKDIGLRTELAPAAKCVVRIAFDEALIREHCAGVNVDPDEAAVACRTKSERCARIVAKDIEANRQFDCRANGAAGGGHGGNGFGSNVCPGERNVTEVLDKNRVSAAAFVGLCVGDGRCDYFFQVPQPARGAGKRAEVDDTD
jgi:hypothetical protein